MFDLMPFEHRARNLSSLFDAMERSFFSDLAPAGAAEIRTDIRDTGDSYLLEAELPGFKKEEIRLDLNGDTLTISAKHENTAEEKGDNGYLRRERRYGAFARSFDVSGIKTEGITASYENGVLTLELPKAVPTRPVSRQIELK